MLGLSLVNPVEAKQYSHPSDGILALRSFIHISFSLLKHHLPSLAPSSQIWLILFVLHFSFLTIFHSHSQSHVDAFVLQWNAGINLSDCDMYSTLVSLSIT